MKKLSLLLTILASPALAQQSDPAKILPMLQQQRNAALDAVANCAAMTQDLQARIAELERKLAEASQLKDRQGQ